MGTGGAKRWHQEANEIVDRINRGLRFAGKGGIDPLRGVGDGEYHFTAFGRKWTVKFMPKDEIPK